MCHFKNSRIVLYLSDKANLT